MTEPVTEPSADPATQSAAVTAPEPVKSTVGEPIADPWLPVFFGQATAARVAVVTVVVSTQIVLGTLAWDSSLSFGQKIATLAFALCAPLLVATDIAVLRLPSILIAPISFAALFGAGWEFLHGNPMGAAYGLMSGAVCFFVFALAWFCYPVGAMGFGDVRLAGALGLALGLQGPVVAAAAVFVLPVPALLIFAAPVIGIRRLVTTRTSLSSSHAGLPYGPFLLIGAGAAALCPGLIDLMIA